MVIGIVGGIGAGKSTVVALINEIYPLSIISADLIGHEILLKGHEAYEPIIKAFGEDLLDEEGEIVRKRLGAKVFGNLEHLTLLNQITHPIITKLIKEKIANFKEVAPHRPILLEAALLLESGLVDLVDEVIAVYADEKVRTARVTQRDGLDEMQIKARIEAQKAWHVFKEAADFIIDNSISLEATKEQVAQLVQVLKRQEEG